MHADMLVFAVPYNEVLVPPAVVCGIYIRFIEYFSASKLTDDVACSSTQFGRWVAHWCGVTAYMFFFAGVFCCIINAALQYTRCSSSSSCWQLSSVCKLVSEDWVIDWCTIAAVNACAAPRSPVPTVSRGLSVSCISRAKWQDVLSALHLTVAKCPNYKLQSFSKCYWNIYFNYVMKCNTANKSGLPFSDQRLFFLADRTLATAELLAWLSSICPSACNGCIVANGYGVEETLYHELVAMGVKLGRAKFQPSTPRETFLKWGLNGRGLEKCAFSNGKVAISRKRWEIRPRLLLITNRKSHTPCQITWKSLI